MASQKCTSFDKDMAVFKTLLADTITTEELIATTIGTHRVDLDGISLSGLMLRKLLADSQRIVSASNGDDISALAREIRDLKQSAQNLASQLSAITSQLASINTSINQLTISTNEANSFINILKTNALVFT